MATKTIRYYESIGLLPEPARTSGNYRDYGEDFVGRLAFIKDSQAAGLTLADIASIVEMKEAGRSTCDHTRQLVDRHLEEIDAQIAALEANRRVMVALKERAAAMDPITCSDPNRCQIIADRHDLHADAGDRTVLPLA